MKLVSRNLYRSLLRLIAKADSDVAAALEAFLRLKEPTRKQRMVRAAEVKAVLDALNKAAEPEVARVVQMAYDTSRKATLREPGLELFPEVSNFSRVHRDAVNLLTENLVATLGEATTTLGRRTEDVFRRHQLRTSAEQLVREQPLPVAAGRLEQRLRADGLTAFVDKAGRRWNLTTYARMAIKTTVADAQSHATVNAMLSRGLDLADVAHTEKHHPEDECSQWEGGPWSLTGRTPGYPRLEIMPPFHPNCDHFLKPSREGLIALKDRAA